MTFEDVYNKLSLDGTAETLEDASEMLHVLLRGSQRVEALVALALTESKRHYHAPRWAFWAAETFHLPDANFAHHRQKVGEMLSALRKESEKTFSLFLDFEITKLDAWTALYHFGCVSTDSPSDCTAILNFLKAYPESPRWKRDRLRMEIDRFLHPGRTENQMELALKFDAVGEILSDAKLSELTQAETFSAPQAFVMAYNGAKLCCHAAGVIRSEAEAFSPEQLEDIEHDLDSARKIIRAMILTKRNTMEKE